ncbi:MAG: nucleotidyltransferase family protein [Gammaproteobacteria bacterium]|jgi:molybdenum cofactor cytidylyltransferase|nr:nucleotidyltransferase family protein [Gammaproteobacteria bacterium]MBT3859573.1 nucleotidyltransferase family protein [Gammaproteobacteria bacterium]MBT3986533.1 nucleotidyltransferase family protein [Gammaproteobacteria bacterium]MBT4254636.1 nucleotidyltransferase family protein [Gammaproteobacteria bacterium]MBT4581123.1 nucleotidyltransferase family protein [Gammaproteobacteria bacterium]
MLPNTGAIVLAAGFSRRFGGNKLNAKLSNNKTVFQQTIERLTESVPEVIVVSRADIAPILQPYHSDVRIFSGADQGMGSTLAFAIQQIQNWDACLICLADMPFINPASYRAIADLIEPNSIVVPSYSGQIGNPVAFSSEYFPELSCLQGDSGGRTLMKKHTENIIKLNLEDAGILQDIDTEDDLQRYQAAD